MQKDNVEYINIMRGICILLVVFGHTIIPAIREYSKIYMYIYNFIYEFHMPVFFFASGLLFERNKKKYDSKKTFIAKKAKLLLVPYLFFSMVNYVIIYLAFNINKFRTILESQNYNKPTLWDFLLGVVTYEGHIDKHLWFVYALFVIFIISIILKNVNTKKNFIISIIGFLVFDIVNCYIEFPALIVYIIKNYIFFSLGRMQEKDNIKITKVSNYPKKVIALISMIAFAICKNSIGIRVLVTGISIIVAIIGIILIKDISIKICEFSNKKIKQILLILNKYSYDIYLIHQPFIVSGGMAILWKHFQCFYIESILVTIISILISIIISSKLLRKYSAFSWVIGNRK